MRGFMKFVMWMVFISISFNCFAVKIKLATLVPTGTSWAMTLKKMSKEIKKATDGKVRMQIYYGGVQGDEPDVIRKARVGQLHGGVFTGKTLGDIFSDVRIMELPFNFYDDDKKALRALAANNTQFNKRFLKHGYVNLGFYGIGKVYAVSTKKVKKLSDLQGVKMWAWEGDEVVRAMMDSLKLVSVPLALPDVMSSLSTGMIEAAYAPPLGILALQWQNKIKYLIDFPIAYSIGALLITNKQWQKVSMPHQKIIRKIATKYVDEANILSVEDNKNSLNVLREMGVEFIEFSKEEMAQAESIRKNVISKLEGKVLSKEIIQKMETLR